MVGPLWIGFINAWLSPAVSRHRWTVPFSLGTITKLLHDLAVLSNPRGTIICCSCNLCNSFLSGSCSVYAMHMHGNWYTFASSLTNNENVPSKHPNPMNTSLYLPCKSCAFCTCHHISLLIWTGNKVVYFLFNFIAMLWINFFLIFAFLDLSFPMQISRHGVTVDVQQLYPLTFWHT